KPRAAGRRAVGAAGLDVRLLDFPCAVRVLLHDPLAGIPAEDGIVVSLGAERHRLAVPVHRQLEEARRVARVGPAPELRLRPALEDDPGVIGALVLAADLVE